MESSIDIYADVKAYCNTHTTMQDAWLNCTNPYDLLWITKQLITDPHIILLMYTCVADKFRYKLMNREHYLLDACISYCNNTISSVSDEAIHRIKYYTYVAILNDRHIKIESNKICNIIKQHLTQYII